MVFRRIARQLTAMCRGKRAREVVERTRRSNHEFRRSVYTTVLAGRGSTVSASNASNGEYQVVLPSLSRGEIALNSVTQHCDVKGRPYRMEDFRRGLEQLDVLKEVASTGACQMNHVWILTL